jgi:diamine N-acetyltransferase
MRGGLMVVTYLSANAKLMDNLKPLWLELNKHHHDHSPYFKEYYQTHTFEDRKRVILSRALGGGEVHLELAYDNQALVGYVVCSIDKLLNGEVDSIFVCPSYRGKGVGRALMERSLAWLGCKGSKKNIVSVAVGNEQAYGFYQKFGFYPRRTMLEQKKH